MVFWILLGAMSLAVALVLARAFARGAAHEGAEVAVYRDQLDELARDLDRGVLSADEAGRARAEVARRLLEADRAAQAAPGMRRGPGPWVSVIVGVAVAGGALALYALLGAPGAGDLPLNERLQMAEDARQNRLSQEAAEAAWGTPWTAPADVDPEYLKLIETLRATVPQRPEDLEGWTLLARHEAALGNYAAAQRAQAHLLGLKGDGATAGDYALLANLMVVAAGGFVSPEAEAALTEALRRDATEPTARYYTGLLFAQNMRPDLAFRLWRPLLEESPPDAPWVAPIRADIEALAALAGVRYTLPPERGPGAADIAAAADMAPEEREAMIRGMVEGLAERLASEGGPAADWARLIGALGVLGEDERARAILTEAETAFAADPDGLAAIREAAARAGLTE